MREIHDRNKEAFSMLTSLVNLIEDNFNILRLFMEAYIKFSVDCKVEEKRRHHDFQGEWHLPVEALPISYQGKPHTLQPNFRIRNVPWRPLLS